MMSPYGGLLQGAPNLMNQNAANPLNQNMMQSMMPAMMQMFQQAMQVMTTMMQQMMGNGNQNNQNNNVNNNNANNNNGNNVNNDNATPDNNQQITNYNNPNKQQTGQMLDEAAKKYGIPSDILKAIAWKESGWNPDARGDGGQSYGMMQIYKSAHPDYNEQEGMRNPAYNIEYGAKFLKGLYDQYGSWESAIQHYNGSGPMAERYKEAVLASLQTKPWATA